MATQIKKNQMADTTKKFIVFCNDANNTVIYTKKLDCPMVKQYARKGAYAIENPVYKPTKKAKQC